MLRTPRHSYERAALLALTTALMSGCWGGPPDTLGAVDGNLLPCPGTPNCVHTGLRHPEGTQGIYLLGRIPPHELMPQLRAVVEAMPRTRVVTEEGWYLHAEVTSRLLRFVDDLELQIMPDRELVVRSASRVGRSDLGVNAERVAALRTALVEAGLVR